MKKAFLKGYYGYKNLGDEILFYGVAKKILNRYNIDKLLVEVDDKKRFNQWLNTNKKLIDLDESKIKLVDRGHKPSRSTLLVLGGGEVLADQRPFPYDGWNMLFKFMPHIISENFVLMGGVSKISKTRTKILYKLLLPKAKEIILREKISYKICSKYNSNTVLYQDFAKETIKDMYKKISVNKKDKIFININPYIYNQEAINFIKENIKEYQDYDKYFIPCDLEDDGPYYEKLQEHIPDLKKWDWSNKDIKQIVKFLAEGEFGIGARLHFSLPLKWLDVDFKPLFYQNKVEKFFK